MDTRTRLYSHRDVAMALFVAAVFILAIVYSVFSATTISDNVSTGGTLTVSGASTLATANLSGHVYASSTVQATGNILGYSSLGVGTTTPGSALAVNGPFLAQSTSTINGSGLIAQALFSTTSLNLYTNSNLSPRLTIDNSGNVGVGTTSPGSALAVNGPGIFVGTSTIFGGLNLESVSATGTLGFYTRGTAAPRMVIDSSGNLGIATSGPATTLSTVGSGYFTAGLGVGYATTGSGNLLVNDLAVVRGRAGVFATTSPYQEFGVAGDAVFGGAVGTSTVSVETTTANRGGCIELRDTDGAWVKIYAGKGAATSTTASYIATGNQLGAGAGLTTILVIEQGRCETAPD
ncbi:MAG: hypothetical protein HYT42_01845 [Candidatus Sungbacteria bacterium]|nr:hypothetical protein [Candidatus Sungbacteria bacterium]